MDHKAIPMTNNFYEASYDGRIRRIGCENYLKPCDDGYGYLTVSLSVNGISKTKKVHSLVALAFLVKPDGKYCINHKDGNKKNNCADNLEYITQSENAYHAHDNHLSKTRKPILQLSTDGQILKEWRGLNEANRAGFDDQMVVRVCRGQKESYKGFVWQYKTKEG